MNRRNFLSHLGASAAGLLLSQAVPNGRVWSFPKNIVLHNNVLPYPTILAKRYQRNNVLSYQTILDEITLRAPAYIRLPGETDAQLRSRMRNA